MGFFRFKEKRTTRNAVITLEQKKSQLQQKACDLQDAFEQQKSEIRRNVEKNWDRQRRNVRNRFPAPRGISLFDIVLLGMDSGRKYTLQEMVEFQGIPEGLTPNWLNGKIVTPLVSQGKLRRVMERGHTYYMLP